MNRALSDKKNIANKNYNNKSNYYSPEKECLDINEIVKQSVDKINNLFNNQKLINKVNEKKDFISSKMNFKNKLNNKTNFTFNINNFINLRKEDNYNNISKNRINNTEIKEKDIKNKKYPNKKKLSLSHQIIDSNKSTDKIKLDDNFKENNKYNLLNKNTSSKIDISILKRNIKKHSINTNYQNTNKKENKNQIDYINQSNQNQKKYIVKNIFKSINSKKPNIIKKIETKVNISPLLKKRNYSFNKYIKDSYNTENNSSESNKIVNKQINKKKRFNLTKKNIINRMNFNLSRSNIKISNSTKNLNQKNIFESNYKRASSYLNKKSNNNKKLFLKEKSVNNSLKRSNDFYFLNKNKSMDNKKNLPLTPIGKGKNAIYKNKSINYFTKNYNDHNGGILKQLYYKKFPRKIKTNDILKLILFLNEYIINNNLLVDYYEYENKKKLDDFSKFLASKINLNYPIENDIDIDDIINKAKIIQRYWRKRKVIKYIKENESEEKKEMKKMIINNYIYNSGFQSQKILGMFHNMLEEFSHESKKSLNNDNNLAKTFYYIQKLIMKDLSSFEKNELYRDYINNIINKK